MPQETPSERIEQHVGRLRGQHRRIGDLNPRFFAFSHVAPWDEDEALRQASLGGPLSGLSVSVKGNIPIKGLAYTEGSRLFDGRLADHDADVVSLARAAGGYIHGATTLSELAMYGVRNAYETMGLNPWNVERTAGGSSTGAGVAASLDLADINIGTDGGGSIRNPAIHCGAVGFMPSAGAISAEGKTRYSRSVESIGLVARSVDLVSRAFKALGKASQPEGAARRRLLVPMKFIETMSDAATLAIFNEDIERLAGAGFELVHEEVEGWQAADRAAGVASLAEAGDVLALMDLSTAGEGIRRRYEAFTKLTAENLEQAGRDRQAFRAAISDGLRRSGASAVLTPGWPFAAPPIDAETIELNGRRVPLDPHRNCFVRPANAINASAITIPTDLYSDEHVPASVQILAPQGDDLHALELASAVEQQLYRLPKLVV